MGILIKDGEVLEAAGNIKTVIFDKTGTLTVGKPVGTDVVGDEHRVLSVAAALEQYSEHPLAHAILAYAKEENVTLVDVKNFSAIEGKGVRGEVDGKVIFVGNNSLLKATLSDEFASAMDKLQSQAKTVVIVSTDDTVLGIIAVQDAPKQTAQAAVVALKQRDIRTVMITGDNQGVADAIAQQVGIDQVIAQVLPADKASHVNELQRHGSVAFVGDGINDAPALAAADLGISMGSGTDIAIESGGIVLVKDDPMDVVRALSLSRKTLGRIKLNLFWAFIYNSLGIPIAAGIFAGLVFSLSPELAAIAMALSSISVVASSLLLNRARFE